MAPRKGMLESILLSDLITSLAESQATGLLTVANAEDTKKLLIDHGQLTISSAGMSERVLLGDLLIARGLVTDEAIEKALQIQKTKPRKLGEILIETAGLTEQQIEEAVRFQIEEEIFDLFTWRKGEFEFKETVSEGERQAIVAGGTSFRMDPRKLVADAATRAEDWRQHEQRITSPYLVFRPTEKSLTPAVQKELGENALKKRVFKWVQENRTVDTMVCKSCIGRNALYKLLVDWIDERDIELVPVGELKFLASEHRSRHRYYDAMGIYRRLREAAPTDAERSELDAALADTRTAMEIQRDTSQQSDLANQTASIAHLKRAAGLRRSRLIRNIVLYGAGGLVALGVIFFICMQLGTDHTQEYQNALDELRRTVHSKVENGQYDAAHAACRKLEAIYPNLASDIDQVNHEIDAEHRHQADQKMADLEGQAGRLDLQDLYRRLDELGETFKDIPGIKKRIEGDRAKFQRSLVERAKALRENGIGKWLMIGRVKAAEGRYPAARIAFFHAMALAGQDKTDLEPIQAAIADIDAAESGQRKALAAAVALDVAGTDLPGAVAAYQAVAKMQPRLAYGDMAQRRADELIQEMDATASQAKATLAAATKPSANPVNAEAQLRAAAIQLAPYPSLVSDIVTQLNALVTRRLEIDSQVRTAQDLENQGRIDDARQSWSDLLQRYPDDLARRKISVPFKAGSTPPGAEVLIDGHSVGKTPCVFRVQVGDDRAIEIQLQGFSPHRVTADERRHLDVEVTLSIEPVWHRALGAAPCNGLAYIGPDLYLLDGGTLMCLRPSTRADTFPPAKLIQIPDGQRHREAADFNTELMPPEWWALQNPPVMDAAKDAVWLPVRDCRLVRVGLGDQQVSAIHTPMEAATPLTLFQNPFQKGAEMALYIGLDGRLYTADFQNPDQPAQAVGKLKFKPIPVVMAGSDTAYGVDDGGNLIQLSIGDWNNTRSFSPAQPITGPLEIVARPTTAGDSDYQALVLESDGGVELIDLNDSTRLWLQSSATISVRTLCVLDDQTTYLQTGLGGGQSLLELRTLRDGPQAAAIWSIVLEGNPVRPCATATTVYVATDDQVLHAYARKDGHLLWKSSIPGLPERMAVGPDGTLALVVRQDGQRSVLFFKVATPP